MKTCLPRPEIFTGYQSLLDGKIFHIIWCQIDPEPPFHPEKLTNIDETLLPNARAKNFDCIVRNLKTLYEEELSQTLLTIPDCLILGHDAGKKKTPSREIQNIFLCHQNYSLTKFPLQRAVQDWNK